MGKEKRLLLLAVMTVLISTTGYGTEIYEAKLEEQYITKNFPVLSGNGHQLNQGIEENGKTKVTNKLNITVNGEKAKGIVLYYDKDKKGENIFVNAEEGKIIIEKGIGIEIKQKGTAVNKGEVIINSGTGIAANGDKTSKFINENKLTVSNKNSIGIIVNSGAKAENNGIIDVKNGGVGINIKNQTSDFYNNENSMINVFGIALEYDKNGKIEKGTASVGIKIDDGEVNNKDGEGVVNREIINVTAGDKLLKNNKSEVVGEVSGVVLNNNANFKNEGTIYVIGTRVGGPSAYQAKGININKAGATVENEGTIVAERDGIGVLSKGTFTNNENGNVYAQNKGIGIQTGNSGKAINKGTVKVIQNSIGINILKDTFAINEKTITTDGTGTGVQLTNGVFINSGKINAGIGNTIVSASGNNTVYLKDGSEITGKILGAEGVDVLTLGKGNHEGLNVGKYEAITTREGDVSISNSTIALEYNKGTNDYLTESKNKLDDIDKKNNESNKKNDETGNLLLKNSNLIIDLKNKKVENPSENILGTMINVDNNKDIILENVKFAFKFNKENKFDISIILNDATDGKITNDKLDYLGSSSTAIWTYSKDKKGNWYATKKTFGEASKSQVDKFAQFLDEGKLSLYTNELQFLSQKEFDKGMAQLSGGLHVYTVDIAAVNSRTLSNTMRERALTRDYLIKRPVNSWTQDISYIDNNHRFGGLMDVKYNEKGVIGISEKQILSNGKLGLVYGGSSGKADAEDNGNIDVDTAYFGGYYNHEFNDKWSLNSNANFVYTHNRVTRNVKIGNLSEEVFKANYPTYTVGMGSSLVYTLKDDLYNKAHFYAGIDVNRIMQGMITEDEDKKFDGAKELAVRKNGAANDKSYYSIVPSAGFMVQNTGYIFDKKYRIGADLNWETEVGNIKDGKRLHMKGIIDEYKVGTTERENVFSYSLFGALNLTEDLAINTKYTSKFSDEYNADMISAGFEYKMDTMGDNGIFGPIFYGIENNKPMSDRWGGTLSLMMETLDDTDRTYYGGGKLNGGDYATSTIYKPKFTLSLNDKKSNLGYYFEGYYQNNKMLQGMKSNEAKMHASRIHGEVRWTDTYSKGKYGINIGYRHEESDKPQNFNQTYYRRTERKVHQLRLTPNFTYELGNGFTFTGKTTGIFEYNYAGDRDSQMDFLMENEYGIVYTGFMPKWRLSLIYFRDDRWYDNSNRKVSWNSKKKEYFYDYNTSGRYQLGQIRPTVIYYFGNGGSFKFDTRIPLGNGQWYDDKKGNKSSGEAYEVRYGFNYYHPVTPGLTMNVGGTFLNIKNKAKNGDITRSYSFRPNIGFSYSF